ncbi:hypothetical protein, partial [Salmonella enterica]|uniref:hypothetical protein n=1 Tax=Salmonella enterica TaxID=28901 RepID=UPI001F4E3D57
PQNDVTLKMPAFEWVHVQLHQQKGMISLSPPTICNSASLPPSLDAGGQAVLDARVRSVYLSLSVQRSHRFPYSTIKKPPKSNLYAPFGQLHRPSVPAFSLILYPTRGKQSKSNLKAIFGGFHESICSGFGYWLLQPENGNGV